MLYCARERSFEFNHAAYSRLLSASLLLAFATYILNTFRPLTRDPFHTRIMQTTDENKHDGISLINKTQKEIDSAVGQMRNNIQAVGQRGERLDALQDKTDNLATQANGFRRGANRVRKQMWWKDMKMRMCIIIGIILLLVVIIVPSGKSQSGDVLSSIES